jgi:hypothetical protein
MNTTQEPNIFAVLGCESLWLNVHMENIEQGRPIEFIRHRRETGGYEKVTELLTMVGEIGHIIVFKGLTTVPK